MSSTGDRAGVFQVCVVTGGRVGSCQEEVSAASVRLEDTSVRTAPSPPGLSPPNPLSCSEASDRGFTSPSL